MKKENRAIVVVLDSLGVGELPDAAQFGDAGCHTPVSYTHLDVYKRQPRCR